MNRIDIRWVPGLAALTLCWGYGAEGAIASAHAQQPTRAPHTTPATPAQNAPPAPASPSATSADLPAASGGDPNAPAPPAADQPTAPPNAAGDAPSADAPPELPSASEPVVAAEAQARVDVPAPKLPRRVTVPVMITGGVAALSLVVGTGFAIDATIKHGSYKSNPDADKAASGERSAVVADILFGTTALFGITAAALYFIRDDAPEPQAATAPAKSPKVRWTAAPAVMHQGGGVSAVVQF